MTLKQSNTNTMFTAVLQYLDKNQAVWKGNSVVFAGVLAFRMAKANIDTKAQMQQDSEKKGYTSKKNVDLENMLTLAYRLALRTHNYAVATGNMVMAQATHFSKYSLAVGSEQQILMRCNTIATTATTALASSPAPNADYKILALDVKVLHNAITLITPETAERDVVGGSHVDATATLIALISTAQTKLKSLDRLIEGMVDEKEDTFITGYEVIRRTNDRHGRTAVKPPAT